MQMKSRLLAVVLPILFFGGIALSAALNMWITESSKVPATYTEGDFAGQANPGDIRGSYSLVDIQNAFDVPVEALAEGFGVTENAMDFQVKGLEDIYAGLPDPDVEIGTDSVRLFVALYRSLPYEPEETTVLPRAAVAVLERLGSVSQETLAVLRERSIDVSALSADAGSIETVLEEEASEDRAVKGQTTFGELLSWGLSREQIEETIGMPMGARGAVLRDFFLDAGLEFSAYKTVLQELVDTAR